MEINLMPQEPLEPALRPYLVDGPLGPFLNHPLVQDLTACEAMFGNINARYRYKLARVTEALKAREWETYIWLHERPYRAAALQKLLTLRKLQHSSPAFAALCAEVWVDSENIPQELQFWKRAFKRTNGRDWMNPREQKEFDALPDTLTLHRGVCYDGGYSWTRDPKVAKFFANRGINGSTGEIISCTIRKSQVFAYLTRRGELEILTGVTK